MAGTEGFFGERVAAVYDERAADMFDPAVVGPVADVSPGSRVTGARWSSRSGPAGSRCRSPSAALASPASRQPGGHGCCLAEKPGADQIEVVVGDMAATRVDGEFSLESTSSSTRSPTW